MPNRYYSHHAGGWKFLLLDTFPAEGCLIDLSGNWWDAGKYISFGPAYVIVDLFVDGTFRHDVAFWD
jgi:hypothetical protein